MNDRNCFYTNSAYQYAYQYWDRVSIIFTLYVEQARGSEGVQFNFFDTDCTDEQD